MQRNSLNWRRRFTWKLEMFPHNKQLFEDGGGGAQERTTVQCGPYLAYIALNLSVALFLSLGQRVEHRMTFGVAPYKSQTTNHNHARYC